MTMLVVDHLAKTYGDAATGVEAIREISFDVREREFVCIVGPSGGGKTTLLRALCGLHPKSGGSIELRRARGHRAAGGDGGRVPGLQPVAHAVVHRRGATSSCR